MPIIETVVKDRRVPESVWLNSFASNTYTQGGEDGIIAEIFRVLDEGQSKPEHWCVEFGAWDGLHLSNTARLIREEGWHAVLIEGEAERCAEIAVNHPFPDRVFPMHRWVGFEPGKNTIDDILAETSIPREFDLISIDVDSVDYYIWESIIQYQPRCVVIEFNPTIPHNVIFVQDKDMGLNEGCSLAALIKLGKKKGYELVCATGNAFFVRKADFHKFNILNNSIEAMLPDRPNYIWNCYNGKVYHTMPKMNWWGRHVRLKPDTLQVVKEFFFHGRKQGLAYPELDVKAADGLDLTTPAGILSEIFDLRANRASMDPTTFAERQKAAWSAAKAHMLRSYGAVDVRNQAVQD